MFNENSTAEEVALMMNNFSYLPGAQEQLIALQGTAHISSRAEGDILVSDFVVHNWERFNAHEAALKQQRAEYGIDEQEVEAAYQLKKIADNRIIVRIDYPRMLRAMMKGVSGAMTTGI